MNEIIETKDLPEDEKIYMKKGRFSGWRIVYPLKNEDGSWNMKNLLIGGNWTFLFKVVLILGLFFGSIFIIFLAYQQDVSHYASIISEMCNISPISPYCLNQTTHPLDMNMSEIYKIKFINETERG